MKHEYLHCNWWLKKKIIPSNLDKIRLPFSFCLYLSLSLLTLISNHILTPLSISSVYSLLSPFIPLPKSFIHLHKIIHFHEIINFHSISSRLPDVHRQQLFPGVFCCCRRVFISAGALWDKTRSFWDIKNSLSHERTDERVAQYFSLYSWLFSTIVGQPFCPWARIWSAGEGGGGRGCTVSVGVIFTNGFIISEERGWWSMIRWSFLLVNRLVGSFSIRGFFWKVIQFCSESSVVSIDSGYENRGFFQLISTSGIPWAPFSFKKLRDIR